MVHRENGKAFRQFSFTFGRPMPTKVTISFTVGNKVRYDWKCVPLTTTEYKSRKFSISQGRFSSTKNTLKEISYDENGLIVFNRVKETFIDLVKLEFIRMRRHGLSNSTHHSSMCQSGETTCTSTKMRMFHFVKYLKGTM